MIPKSILEKLEPECLDISSGNPLLISIAISIKRIADVACELDYVDEVIEKERIKPPPPPDPSEPFKR